MNVRTSIIILGLVFLISMPIAHAVDFTVTKIADTADGTCDNDCSLRESIIASNGNGEADVITVPAGTYTLAMDGEDDTAALGDLDIRQNLTISGAGSDSTFIDGSGLELSDRVFDIDPLSSGITVSISNITIQNGLVSGEGGGIRNRGTLNLTQCTIEENEAQGGNGGGIANLASATLNITNSILQTNTTSSDGGALSNEGNINLSGVRISENIAEDEGGGIVNFDGTLTLENCLLTGNSTVASAGGALNVGDGTISIADTMIVNNTSADDGGALFVSGSGTATLVISNTLLEGNSSDGSGGAIFYQNAASLTIERSLIHDNESLSSGGGIHTRSDMTLENVTMSGNRAGAEGGGIFHSDGILSSLNSTITENIGNSDNTDPDQGGGVRLTAVGGSATFKNTIIAGNTNDAGNPDCFGTLTSAGFNLIEDTTGCTIDGDTTGNITGEDPLLGPLAQNGGPTMTHALLSGSPAIDGGTNTDCPATDQRGVVRPADGDLDGVLTCDIGALESTPCGDGVEQILAGEECDDGNTDNTDSCLNTCIDATCGDGFVQEGAEECDDGNDVDTDACRIDCTLPSGGCSLVRL